MIGADKVMETALAALAERTASAGRTPADAPWSWNPRDVWLTRASQPRKPAATPPVSNPTTPPHQDTALRD